MANISVTYTFSNGTAADAGEVNTNFTDIINGTSDGTKDFSINALTCAGTATFNGNVTLGNATTDTITFTGRMATSLVPTTAATYDLGTSSLPWQHLYLDNGATDAGTIYFGGGTTQYIQNVADGTELDFGGFTYLDTNGAQIKTTTAYVEAKSGDYTVTDTDGVSVILMTTSTTNRVVTLPTAADNTGRIIKIIKVDSGAAKCTVKGEAAGETVGGISGTTGFDLLFQNDFVEVLCTGSIWHVISYNEFSEWFTYTPGIDSTNGNASLGTITTNTVHYRRSGDAFEMRWFFHQSGSGTAGTGDYRISMPTSFTVNTSVVTTNDSNARQSTLGNAYMLNWTGFVGVGTTGDLNLVLFDTIDFDQWGQPVFPLSTTTLYGGFNATVPVTELANTVPQ